MKAIVAGELGMEGGGEQMAFLGSDDAPVRQGGQPLRRAAHLFDQRGADEDGVHGLIGCVHFLEGRRPALACTPSRDRTARCSAKSPWRANTPIFIRAVDSE